MPQRIRSASADDDGEGDTTDETEDDSQEPDVWPCNVQPVEAFVAMQTQWRMGFAGRTGLDYGVLPQVLGWLQVPGEQQAQVWADVQVMEIAALQVWAQEAKRDQQRKEQQKWATKGKNG